jgi:uncharacterized protein YndB with AHSA1/START domain
VAITTVDIIPAAPDHVFQVASDPEIQLRWDRDSLRAVEKLSSGPLGKGSRYRGKFKGIGTVEYEFAEFDPPHRFTHRTHMPFGSMNHRLTFDPAPEGTRLTQEAWLEPNLIGRVIAPIANRMLGRRLPVVARELREYVTRAESASA